MNSPTRHRYFWLTLILTIAIGLLQNAVSFARELKVSRSETGAYRTIQLAVNAALPGDVVVLDPASSPYYESVAFDSRSGTAAKPIILEGNGAALDGTEPLRTDEWQQIKPGLFRSTALPARLRVTEALPVRYFFLFNGVINRMGQVSKGISKPFKQPAQLASNEWTYIEAEKAFYLNLADGQPFSAVRVPVRANGVGFSGRCEHIQIRNLAVTHVWNDGFNIHNYSRNIIFKNIRALECGDDGISAHEDCQIAVDGLISVSNATGFCHVGQSQSSSLNVRIQNCLAYGIFLTDKSRHTIRNVTINSVSGYALSLITGATARMNNVLLTGDPTPQYGILVDSGANLTATNIAVWNLPWTVRAATVALCNSATAAPRQVIRLLNPTLWDSNNNLWDINGVFWQNVLYPRASFAAYVRVSKQDTNSKITALPFGQLSAGKLIPYGVDARLLPRND